MKLDLRATHRRTVSLLLVAAALVIPAAPGTAQEGRITFTSKAPFPKVAEALEKAIADQNMGLVCHANAQKGAAFACRSFSCSVAAFPMTALLARGWKVCRGKVTSYKEDGCQGARALSRGDRSLPRGGQATALLA